MPNYTCSGYINPWRRAVNAAPCTHHAHTSYAQARCWRALARGSRVSSRPARRHPRPSMLQKAVARRAVRRLMLATAPANKLQRLPTAPCSMILSSFEASRRPPGRQTRSRSSMPCPVLPAPPARAAVRWVCQPQCAELCMSRACAWPCRCALECVRSRVRAVRWCGRARKGSRSCVDPCGSRPSPCASRRGPARSSGVPRGRWVPPFCLFTEVFYYALLLPCM